MFRVAYSRIEDIDLYEVRLFAINQTIVLSRNVLVSKIGMNPRVLVGCKDLSIHEIIDLGFIFPSADLKMVL